jgi:hypothetical protein
MERLRKQLQQGESDRGRRLSSVASPGCRTGEGGAAAAAPLWPRRMDRNLQPARCQPVAGRPGAADAVAGGRPAGPGQVLVNGPAFWQTSEISECPALLDASLMAMSETVAA